VAQDWGSEVVEVGAGPGWVAATGWGWEAADLAAQGWVAASVMGSEAAADLDSAEGTATD
jgi:hypothetical protein